MATPDKTQAIGEVALQQLNRRMKLLETARGSSRWVWISSLIAVFSAPLIFTIVDVFFQHTSYSTIILLCLLPVIFIIRLDVSRAHSRLDALIQLVGEESLLND
jgi:hypothetical protein